jgi:hypothetical protein
VNRKIVKILVAGGLSLLLASSVLGEVIPTNAWVNFYGSASQYNSKAIPIGSVINAYDPNMVHCGSDTVTIEGKYGFLPVYGDDASSQVDEGAIVGDQIYFTINGRPAVNNGPDGGSWDGEMGSAHEANLSATASISLSLHQFPNDKQARPGDTVRYTVAIRNTGQGLDFYKIRGVSNNGWIIKPQFGFSYAPSNGIAYLYIDLLVPPMLFGDTFDIATIHISSGIDSTVFFERSVRTLISPTDAPVNNDDMLPSGFNLNQNFPNPFNPTTVIGFDLPRAAKVSLEIYDLLGRRVDAIDMGCKVAGHHNYEYSAGSLTSGIYFYRVRAGELSDIKKMILLK